jgi:hypothetical protein
MLSFMDADSSKRALKLCLQAEHWLPVCQGAYDHSVTYVHTLAHFFYNVY